MTDLQLMDRFVASFELFNDELIEFEPDEEEEHLDLISQLRLVDDEDYIPSYLHWRPEKSSAQFTSESLTRSLLFLSPWSIKTGGHPDYDMRAGKSGPDPSPGAV